MEIEIVSYQDLLDVENPVVSQEVKTALFKTGIICVRNVPGFEKKSFSYVKAARKFSILEETIKKQYSPNKVARSIFFPI